EVDGAADFGGFLAHGGVVVACKATLFEQGTGLLFNRAALQHVAIKPLQQLFWKRCRAVGTCFRGLCLCWRLLRGRRSTLLRLSSHPSCLGTYYCNVKQSSAGMAAGFSSALCICLWKRTESSYKP